MHLQLGKVYNTCIKYTHYNNIKAFDKANERKLADDTISKSLTTLLTSLTANRRNL